MYSYFCLPSLVALASTLLAMTAVHRIKPKKEATPAVVPDEAVIQILRAAVQSANVELEHATAAAAKTFGIPRGVSPRTKTATVFSSGNLEPSPINSAKAPKSAVMENVGADVVQLRPLMEVN